MCLTRVETTYDQPSDLIVDGWKVFLGGASAAPCFAHNKLRGNYAVALDSWITADSVEIKAVDGKSYKTGFHAYADEHNKHKDATRRVYLRKITCEGQQDGNKAVVAQEMYVPSRHDAWPPRDTPPPPTAAKKNKLMDRIKRRGVQ
jgi:hypothetical protein